jgi:hypothetical protein
MTNKDGIVIPDVCDLIELRADHPQVRPAPFGPSRWRVDGWLKSHTYVPPTEDEMFSSLSVMLNHFLASGCREFDCGKGPTRLVSCTREEAEYVSGSGVDGCIWPIEDVVITGNLDGIWSAEQIADERRSALLSVGTVLF